MQPFKVVQANVGIGTTSPSARLDIKSSVLSTASTEDVIFNVQSRPSGGGTPDNLFQITQNNNGTASSTYGVMRLGNEFTNSGTPDKVIINSNGSSYFNGGNVGIGHSSPENRLHLDGGGIAITGGSAVGSGDYANRFLVDAGASISHNLALFKNNDGTVMRVTGSRVGIGTSNPTEMLQVLGKALIGTNTDVSPNSSGEGYIQLDGDAYTGYHTLDATAYYLGHNSSSRDLVLQTDETDRLAIGGNGSITFNNAYTFPATDGVVDQVLTTNGSGQVTWANQSGGGGSDAWTDDGSVVRLTTATDRVGIGTSSPDASAELDVSSTTKGFLPPRMDQTERNLILSPAAGLVIFNTSTNCLNFYSGTSWFSTCGSVSSDTDTTGGGINNNWDFGGGYWNNQGLDSIWVNGDWLYVYTSDHASNPGVQWESVLSDHDYAEHSDAGHSNTTNIKCNPGSDDRAPRICDTSTVFGFSDWFLPSKDELEIMAAKKDSLTNFTTGTYWSSTQHNTSYAYRTNVAAGGSSYSYKHSSYFNVRCVRRSIGGAGNSVPYIMYNAQPLFVHKIDNSDAKRYEVSLSDISGAEDEYNGWDNTIALGAHSDAHAGKICDTLNAYGVSDWYLPARNELDALYTHRYEIGGFDASAFYWSSTQHNTSYAYARFFGPSSNSSYTYKHKNYYHVRCVTRTAP